MSGGSQHNPNGRQSQLGPGWSPLQLQVANLLGRAPQAHMASDRGVTWHTPTPPPHLYHVPQPSPPDPLQAMKSAGNSVFRHTATPPELYRHTPTPPDKHHMRHTPSPGDVKAGSALPPADLYPHLGPGRDKLRPEEILSYARGGVDLSLSGRSSAAGAPSANGAGGAGALGPSPALSVRDAPTINSLIARAAPRPPHARVDALLERLAPSPAGPGPAPAAASPHSVIVHSRPAPTPSPTSSNEDSTDSCGAPPGSKRKRKPERTIRVPAAACPGPPPAAPVAASPPPPAARVSPPPAAAPAAPAGRPLENGDAPHARRNGPSPPPSPPAAPPPQHQQPPQPDRPPTRRKTRSGSAETIDDIAAMIASTTGPDAAPGPPAPPEPVAADLDPDVPATVDKLKSVLSSPEPPKPEPEPVEPPAKTEEKVETPAVEAAAAPRRRSARTSNSEATNVPVESPSEAKPAEPESSDAPSAEPTAASFVEVENQLEKMFAGLEEAPGTHSGPEETNDRKTATSKARKRRKSAPTTKGERKADRKTSRRSSPTFAGEDIPRKKIARKKSEAGKGKKSKEASVKDAYDSGSNASSSRSRGPYIQIRGPRDSPLSVSVINASTGEEEGEATTLRRKTGDEFRNGLRARGLHASTLGLRYDASTPDASWLCGFCERGPHAQGLGDLFGPYTITTDCEEYRSLDEATRRRYASSTEVWFHEACGVWAPGLVAAGARLWGLAGAVWAARGARCGACGRAGAALACRRRACRARAHLPCARPAHWALCDDTFQAHCPRHT